MVNRSTIFTDVLSFIKSDLISNITDPISGSRKTNSKFVMTSYPQREVDYPLITLKMINMDGRRAGMQTEAIDISFNLEIRVWARNEKEKDNISQQVIDRLASIQFTASTGSIAADIHDFRLLSATEVDEDGETGIKSRIIEVSYNLFNTQ
jgi:hypothetical protein